MTNLVKTCLSISCPERKSVCCSYPSVIKDGNNAHFVCGKCGKPYVGGKCTANDHLPVPTREEMLKACEPQKDWREEFDEKFVPNVKGFAIMKDLMRPLPEVTANYLNLKHFVYGHIAEAEERGRREAFEEVWKWAVENGITHKECFVALRDFLEARCHYYNRVSLESEKETLQWVLAHCTSADWPEKIMQRLEALKAKE